MFDDGLFRLGRFLPVADTETISAGRLGQRHALFGQHEKFLDGLPGIPPQRRQAKTDCQRNRNVFVFERFGIDRRTRPLAQYRGFHAPRGRSQDGELPASRAGHGVFRAARGRQSFGEPDEDLIADLIAIFLVERAEVVDVDADDGYIAVMTLGVGDILHAVLQEVTPAVQLRERVDRRLFFQRRGGFLQFARGLIELGVGAGSCQQLHAVDGLDDEIGRATGERALAGQFIVGAGDDDDGNIAHAFRIGGADAADQRVAVEFRHLDVGDQHFDGTVLEQVLPRGFSVSDLDELEFVAEYLADGLANDARVIRHQHPDLFGRGRGGFWLMAHSLIRLDVGVRHGFAGTRGLCVH